MSIFKSLLPGIRAIYNSGPERKYTYAIVAGWSALHALYAYSTVQENPITIKEKYQTYDFNIMKYHIVDTDNNHYCIGYSLWYFQYNVPELWTSIEKNKTYNVKHYGYRIPFLGIFPNIINF